MAAKQQTYPPEFREEAASSPMSSISRYPTWRHAPGAAAFAAALEDQIGADVRCIPGFTLHAAHRTTIGLGDAVVGSFLAAVRQRRAVSWT
jgi:hypothetical protein